jgi:ABC-2 type transport system ATP-binding protein
MQPAVTVQDLTIRYARTGPAAVDKVSFQVAPGQVLGVLGGNGAGKTSTMRVLAGVNPATSGEVHVGGVSVHTARGADQVRQMVGYCPDTGGLIRQATVREHIAIALGLRGATHRWPAALELAERFDLTRVLDQPTTGFSHGMSRRLSVLLATITAEQVLILDEPFDGVDPLGVQSTVQVIQDAKAAGLAVLVSTHLLSLLHEVSDDIAVMARGHLVDHAPASQFAGVEGQERYAALLSGQR